MHRDLAAHFVLAAALSFGALACGGYVLFEQDEPQVSTEPEPEREPDPCNQWSGTMRECCDAGCRRFGHDAESVCISAENDCDMHPDLCRVGEVCGVIETSGRGGCSYGYDMDYVGICEPATGADGG